MNHLEGSKTVAKIGVAVAVGATHSHEIDTIGHSHASIDVAFSAFTAAVANYAPVLKLQQSNTSGSGQADIAGLSVTAGAGFAVGGLGGSARFNVDLRGKGRYITVVASPGSVSSVCSIARLSKSQDMPTTAATAGVNNVVSG